jgi:PAS domain S-box-containing protein
MSFAWKHPSYHEAVIEQVPTPLMVLDRRFIIVDANRAYRQMIGRRRHEVIGRSVFEVLPDRGDRRATMIASFEKAFSGETSAQLRVPMPVHNAKDSPGVRSAHWWSCRHVPVKDPSGAVTRIVQHAEDVTEQVEAEILRDAVMADLRKRVISSMETLLTIARRTARNADGLTDFMAHIEAQIASMIDTQAQIFAKDDTNLTLRAMVELHLAAYLDSSSREITIDGPDVTPAAADLKVLSLVLQELAMLSMRSGALSVPGGQLAVKWSVEPGDAAVKLSWEESPGGAPSPGPKTESSSLVLDVVAPAYLPGAFRRQSRKADGGQLVELSFRRCAFELQKAS